MDFPMTLCQLTYQTGNYIVLYRIVSTYWLPVKGYLQPESNCSALSSVVVVWLYGSVDLKMVTVSSLFENFHLHVNKFFSFYNFPVCRYYVISHYTSLQTVKFLLICYSLWNSFDWITGTKVFITLSLALWWVAELKVVFTHMAGVRLGWFTSLITHVICLYFHWHIYTHSPKHSTSIHSYHIDWLQMKNRIGRSW